MARAEVETLRDAIDMYARRSGLPGSLGDLVPTAMRKIRPDPWGTPYVYTRPGERYEIRSLGPDRVPSSDDIVAEPSALPDRSVSPLPPDADR